jgi:hypothetical protein
MAFPSAITAAYSLRYRSLDLAGWLHVRPPAAAARRLPVHQ